MSVSHRHMNTNDVEHLDDFEEDIGDETITEEYSGSILGETKSSFLARTVKQTDFLKVGVLEGTTFLNDYVVVDTLGRGSHGKVKLCLNVIDNDLYAIKIVETTVMKNHEKSTRLGRSGGRLKTVQSSTSVSSMASIDTKLEQESDVMKSLDHPNLVRLYEVIRSVSSGKVLMVMEYCEAGPLIDQQGKFSHCQDDMPEIIVQHFFRQITSAVEYLHSRGVVHGDIKPENMLLSGDGSLKISDFGQSQMMSNGESKLTKTLGTPAFLAPEICAGDEYDGFAADIWALGATLYFFIFGKVPFVGQNIIELYDNIAEKDVIFPDNIALSINLQDLFLRLLNKNPKHRITIEELVVHPWVCEDDLAEVERNFSDLEDLEYLGQSHDGSEAFEGKAGPSYTNDDVARNITSGTGPDSSGFAAMVLQSLAHQGDQREGIQQKDPNLMHNLNDSSASLGKTSSVENEVKDESDEQEIRSMQEFQNLAQQLLATQKLILSQREASLGNAAMLPQVHRSAEPLKDNGVHKDGSLDEFPGRKSMVDSSSTQISDKSTAQKKSPFDMEDLHTSAKIKGAALMHFRAGDKIDDFGKGNDEYAYFIDQGVVELKYLADLPVSFDEVVGSCLYDVIKTKMSPDFGRADSLCLAESTSNITISSKSDARNKNSGVDKSSSSFFTSMSPFQYFYSKREEGETKQFPCGSVEESVYHIVETVDRVMKSFSNGSLGNLLSGNRKKSQFIGVLSLLEPEYFQNKWYFSAVAISDVTVIRMTKSCLEKFLTANPLSQVHLRASMATTVSEIIKLEAFEKIALARRKMLSSNTGSSSTSFTTLGISLEEVAKHITDTAAAGADILAKLDIFALASRLRDEVQGGFKKEGQSRKTSV